MIDKVIFDKLMMRYRHLGTRKIETTGAFLIGNASHIASEAWLNSVYLCLSEQEIKNKIIEMRHDYKDYASFFYLYI